MYIDDNAHLIQALLEQISADIKIDSVNLVGDQELVLFGLREMITLGLVSGAYHYSANCDPIGPLLSSVSGVSLTKRGLIFTER